MPRPLAQLSEEALPVAGQAADLSVIVPTFNERQNVDEVLQRLESCLNGEKWEVIFVDDDSTDGTAEYVREIARRKAHVRCLHRIGRRGLSSACVEGILASASPYVAIMDADCQHDESILPRMFEILRNDAADVVVGSRYTDGGGVGEWNAARAKMSRLATRLSRGVVKQTLSDPMSGFFAFQRKSFMPAVRGLSNIGFKILLDMLASSPEGLRVKEVPYEFRTRHAGESKLDSQALWGYLMLLLDKLVGHIVPVRFIAFALVGAVGVLVHFAVMVILFSALSFSFRSSQAAATLLSMTCNFVLNNSLTYRDMRLKGWRWLKGWASFVIACSLGAVANIGIASYLFRHETLWALASFAGIVVGAGWNYAITASYTWKTSGKQA